MVSLVTNSGLSNVMAAWHAYASRPLYFQFGTGSGQTGSDSDLAAPVQSRVLGTSSQETENVAGDTFHVEGTLTADEDRTITEVGVFDDAIAGSMDVYGDFSSIELADGDAIVFSVNITVSAA